MRFNEKEMAIVLSKKIDKIIFQSKGQNILAIDLEAIIRKNIEGDDNLKKQLLMQALESED